MANIYFKNLIVDNFISYEHAEISLDRTGYVLVNGINNNKTDNAKSNGCGKSSLFSAITWCLTGETNSGAKDVSNIYTEGSAKVELQFKVDKNEYSIIRSKYPSNLKIFINGEDKSGKGIRDTEKLMQEYLPDITSSLLSSVIILGQGLPQKFTNNSPSGRKEVLEKLSNSDYMITDIKTKIAQRKSYLDNELRKNEDEKLKLTTELNIKTNSLEQYKNQIRLLTEDEKVKLSDSISSWNIKVEECSINIVELTEELEKYEKELSEFNISYTAISEEKLDGLSKLELEDTGSIAEDVSKLLALINSKEKEIKKLESVVDICPTCGQKLVGIEKIDTSDLKAEKENLKVQVKDKQEDLKKKKDINSKIVDEYNRLYDSKLQTLNDNIKTINNKLADRRSVKQKNIENKTIYEKSLYEAQTNLDIFDDKKNDLSIKIEESTQEIEKLNAQILYINNIIDKLNERLQINTKMSTIVKRDFRGYLLSNVIDFISSRAKAYSQDIFGTDKLDFKLDGNNISISYDSKEYELLSGGEKQKVDVIIQLSIRDMLCNFLNFSSNILILDEITDSLDVIGSQQVFNLISTRCNDVEAIYIVSHHTDFSIPVDDEIMIMKGDDKISRIM